MPAASLLLDRPRACAAGDGYLFVIGTHNNPIFVRHFRLSFFEVKKGTPKGPNTALILAVREHAEGLVGLMKKLVFVVGKIHRVPLFIDHIAPTRQGYRGFSVAV